MNTKFSSSDDLAIGIDLGTTNCVVAAFINGKVEIIPNVHGTRLTPSYVTYGPNVKECYGKVSKDQAHRHPENTVYEVKRIIGRHWSDSTLQNDIKAWPFQLVEVNGVPKIRIGSHTRYPQEVCAKLLFEFCRSAEKYLGKPSGTIHKAVITVPAYFTEGQRRATIEAGEAAGIKVLTILNEPTAAAIAYKNLRKSSGSKTVLIYDLGGGTFDVAIVKLTENGVETLGVDGDTHLGGADFDQLLVEHCAAEFKKQNKIDLIKGKPGFYRPLSRLRLQCEKAKEALCSFDRTDVDVQSINCGLDLFVSVKREEFEDMIRPLLWKTISIVEKAIKDAREVKSKEDIDDVILVGGSTRIPLVSKMLGEIFPGKRLTFAIDPDEAVAYGAALQAFYLNSTSEEKAKDETGQFENEDVTPMSIGVETKGRKFDCVIKKNSKIPCSKIVIYRTVFDNQAIIRIQVFQGENDLTTSNEKLGDFSIHIPRGPAGKETVEVCMNIKGDGTLNVTAMSRTNGASHSINVEDERLRMDRGAIERLVEELHI